MRRITLALAGVWAFASLLALSLCFVGVTNIPLTLRETVLYRLEPMGEIRGSQSVGQTFKAPYNGLYRIEVFLADYGRRNTGQVVFRLKPVRELPIVLVEKTFAAEEIRGDVMYAITFEPLSDSADRVYYFELESPDAVSGNAITAYIRPHDPYPEGNAFWRGQAQPGDLVFTAHFQPTAWERVLALFNQITANKPWPWNSVAFYIVLGALWLGALFVALQNVVLMQLAEDAKSSSQPPNALPPSVKPGIFLPAVLLLVFVRSLLFSSIIPPWLGPDETGHFEYVALIHALGRVPAPLPDTEVVPELTREINASAEQLGYEQFFDLWRTFGIRSLSEQEPPKLVGPREAGYQRPFYYLMLAPIYGLVARQEILVRYFTLAATSGLLAAFTVWMAAKTATVLFPHSLFIQTLTPLIVAFWPTQAYMASRINNDNLATATAALTMLVIVITVQRGLSWKNGLGLGLCALLAVQVKGSTVFLTPLITLSLLLGALQRWGGLTASRSCVLLGALAFGAVAVGAALLAVFIYPEILHPLLAVAEKVLWPSRSRDWIISALVVSTSQPIFTPERLDANFAEFFRLLMLFWFPYGWQSWLPTKWLQMSVWVFAVALWLAGIAWLGLGLAAWRLAKGDIEAAPPCLWALGLLALAIPMAFLPLLTRMVIDPFTHWWNGRVLMTLLIPVSIFVTFGLRSATPVTARAFSLHIIAALLVLVDTFCLGCIILPGYYG